VSARTDAPDTHEPECSWCSDDPRESAFCSKRCEDEARESDGTFDEPEPYTLAERIADIAWEEGL
jgi:hypothetical protein